MKKYLQACEMGGSIYGTGKTNNAKSRTGDRHEREKGLPMKYNHFYKRQSAVMEKLFNHGS